MPMTTPSRTTITITHADAALLCALNRYHYLTAAQTSRLLYPRLRDEHRYAQRRLKRLVSAGYALRLRALPAPRFGAAPHVRGASSCRTGGSQPACLRPHSSTVKGASRPCGMAYGHP